MEDIAPIGTQLNPREVVISNLRKLFQPLQARTPESFNEQHTLSLTLDDEDALSTLHVRIKEHGYEVPHSLVSSAVEYKNTSKAIVKPYETIQVVSDEEPSNKDSIRLSETLQIHANNHRAEPINVDIGQSVGMDARTTGLAIMANNGMQISFERTARMPDDNKLHQLPQSMGQFGLHNVEAYAERLPRNIRDTGGVFLSMWQREAMWMHFEAEHRHPYALRVFVGHINAISGLEMSKMSDTTDTTQVQDYVVIPGQQWLDGICVATGIVRQFVAMPLGSGYTVEGQKTSEEKHGGLQLEIIPALENGLLLWTPDNDEHVEVMADGSSTFFRWACLDETKTPREIGCTAGTVLRVYPEDPLSYVPFRVKDLTKSAPKLICEAYYVQPPSLLVSNSFSRSRSHVTGGPWLEEQGAPLAYDDNQEMPTPVSGYDYGPAPTGYDYMAADEANAEISIHSSELEEQELNDIKTTNLKAMGLAAGGKLIQDIYKDPYPSATWNYAAARIINVHIFDPVSCEKVTHIVPHPPPVDVKTYTENGGHFFVVEEKVDERLDGGDFENVKSVSQMDKHVGVTTEPEFDPTKPKMCTTCEIRLCDCIIRPCDHQFCNVCIKKLEQDGAQDPILSRKNWKCPTCSKSVSHVAGFSAPMNLPGEEPVRMKVPVNVLKVEDGRVAFSSIHTTRL